MHQKQPPAKVATSCPPPTAAARAAPPAAAAAAGAAAAAMADPVLMCAGGSLPPSPAGVSVHDTSVGGWLLTGTAVRAATNSSSRDARVDGTMWACCGAGMGGGTRCGSDCAGWLSGTVASFLRTPVHAPSQLATLDRCKRSSHLHEGGIGAVVGCCCIVWRTSPARWQYCVCVRVNPHSLSPHAPPPTKHPQPQNNWAVGASVIKACVHPVLHSVPRCPHHYPPSNLSAPSLSPPLSPSCQDHRLDGAQILSKSQ